MFSFKKPARVLMMTMAMSAMALVTPTGTPEAVESNVSPLQSLYMVKQLVPQTQTVGLMWNQTKVNVSDIMPKIDRAAATIGVKVVVEDIEELKDVSQRFRDLTDKYHVQALWVFQDDNIVGSALGKDFLIKNCTVSGIALFAPNTDWVSTGACATLMNEGGAVKLYVNKKTITALGINVPEKLVPDTQFIDTN